MKAYTSIELPGIEKVKSGKVREIFDLGDKYLFVASDRLSAFDCVLPTGIPMKGAVLNQISAWWFERTGNVVPNHMISADIADYPAELQAHAELLDKRSMLVEKMDVLPVECIVRGYLIGSGWKEYQKTGTIAGMPLRAGYIMADKLDEAMFTPSTKAEQGLHDENISYDKMKTIVGEELAERLKSASLRLYREAADYARDRGIIIADTKFEFGVRDGEIYLIDEVLTPDSSRFWPASDYAPGSSPLSFDKQYVRDYLETLDWDKTPPAPALPEEVALKTSEKYLEAYRMLTGREEL
jgi:phosphoribosylaminoimidazole-succinocarboxamide synthase